MNIISLFIYMLIMNEYKTVSLFLYHQIDHIKIFIGTDLDLDVRTKLNNGLFRSADLL